MKKLLYSIPLILTVLPLSAFFASETDRPFMGISFFSPRSQSEHYERRIIGWHASLYEDTDITRTIVGFTPLYSQSVRPKRMAQALFGKDILTIAGSQVSNPVNHDMLADYFGLSPAFLSTVEVDPFIRNLLLETNIIVLLDSVLPGLYCEIDAPLGFTRWRLQLQNEQIFNNGSTTPFPAGYQSVGTAPLAAPVHSFTQAIAGNVTFGAIKQGIQKGRITDSHTKKGFADLSATLGWNFIIHPHNHVGMYVILTAPTGSRPKSTFLFEPILGNGKHWELGIGFSGHALMWEALEQELNFFTNICFSHIFGARQHRSFDFCANGFASRYMLLKEFDQTVFTGTVIPAINITTLPCHVSNDLQMDMTLMFGYTYNQFVFDIGYNGWFRTKEKISLDGSIEFNKYGIKGIQNVFDVITGQLDDTTQSTATIAGNNLSQQNSVADTTIQFINTDDLNVRSAASPRLLTHTLFVYLGYSWPDSWTNETLTPFFGAGFEIEFEGINERDTYQSDKNTLSQWTAFMRTGITF